MAPANKSSTVGDMNETVGLNDTIMSTTMSQQMQESSYCKDDPLPSAKQIVNSMSVGDMVYHIILIVMATIVVAFFLEELFFVKAKIKLSARRRLTILQLGIPPVFAVSSVVGIFFPAGNVMIDFVCSVYFGFALHGFLVLMINYFNGLRQLLLRFDKKKCVIHTGPFCCCCLCLPEFKMTKKTFGVLWYATFQAAFTRPVVLFFESVFFTNSDNSVPIPGLFYTLVLVSSMLLGMWALVILRRASGDFLARYRVTAKFFNFQMVLLIANLQSFIINKTYFSCDLPYTYRASQLVLNYQISIFEYFVLALITRFLYRRESDNERLDFISQKSELLESKSDFSVESIPEKLNLPNEEVDKNTITAIVLAEMYDHQKEDIV